MPRDAKLEERLTCFDCVMLGREEELEELAGVISAGWGWRGREVNREQQEGVRNRRRGNYRKESSEVLLAWIASVDGGLGDPSGLTR